MIHKPNGWARRILTYPAIHPCESICPRTLLNSLIDLAHAVCGYKSKFFSTNRCNAGIAFRYVSNLLVFLEEIRGGPLDIPDDVVLSLSELHLAFQKLLGLLEDCTLDGARLWMLVNSDPVSDVFRILISAISTGLDVFPLRSVDISADTEELLQLVVRQARESIFDPDPEDKRVLKDLMRVLIRFQHEIAPDPIELKRVLDRLGITRWSDCNKEAKFLDTEIAVEFPNPEKKKELELLSSLAAFMAYCRCVVFDSVDSEGSEPVNSSCLNETPPIGLNVDDLRCPISLEIMSDPVTVSTGHTYDRGSILKWFRSGNATCPNTGERLSSTELIPNLVIKGIIIQCCAENGVVSAESSHKNRDVSRTVTGGSSSAEGAVKMVARSLVDKLVNGGDKDTSKAAFEIRVLTKTSIFNRSCLAEAGAIPHLLALLLSEDSSTQENAIASLLNLSKHPKSKVVIMKNGGLELIVNVLKNGLKVEAKQHAAATIFYLASVEKFRATIGENPAAIPALVDMIKRGNERGKRNAVVAIYGLLSDPENQWRVLASGVVPLLLTLLKDLEREDLVTDSLEVLAALAERVDGTVAILRRGALKMVLKIMESATSRAMKERCVSLLLAVCVNGGGNVVARLVRSSTLMASLYSLLSEGTCRACKKASALIRILQEFHERSSSAPLAHPVLARERFVHVW